MNTSLASLIHHYQPSKETIHLVDATPLLLVVGVTGAGKDTIISALKERADFHRIISHTTRPPRQNFGIMEVHDEHYHFISHDEAESMVKAHEFVEVKYVHGNVYGTSVAEFQKIVDKQQIAMTDIDIQGVKEYLAIKPDTHAIFLLPPSAREWEQRLIKRYGDLNKQKGEITKRLITARYELNDAMRDERFVVVVNDELERTIQRVLGVAKKEVDHTSDMAQSIADELLVYIEQMISTLDA